MAGNRTSIAGQDPKGLPEEVRRGLTQEWRDVAFLDYLFCAAVCGATVQCLEHHILGISQRQLAGFLPLTALEVTAGWATIQQNLQSWKGLLSESKPMEAF